jgi:hypothetical protein
MVPSFRPGCPTRTERISLDVLADHQNAFVVLNRKAFEAGLVPMDFSRSVVMSVITLSVSRRHPAMTPVPFFHHRSGSSPPGEVTLGNRLQSPDHLLDHPWPIPGVGWLAEYFRITVAQMENRHFLPRCELLSNIWFHLSLLVAWGIGLAASSPPWTTLSTVSLESSRRSGEELLGLSPVLP